jgi:tRNA(Ile2) C34 agmatinyltransferase TiaS
MGEVADMMLDGDLCEGCGVYMGSPGDGYPRKCADCQDYPRRAAVDRAGQAKVACPVCGRKVKAVGLKDHQRDSHANG